MYMSIIDLEWKAQSPYVIVRDRSYNFNVIIQFYPNVPKFKIIVEHVYQKYKFQIYSKTSNYNI